MKICDLIKISEDKDCLLAFLQEHNIIENRKVCEKCELECKLIERREKYLFRCQKCKNTKSALCENNQIFKNSRLSYRKLLLVISFFIKGIPQSKCASMTDVNKRSVSTVYSKCMIICKKENYRMKRKIGGEGMTIEIGESVFSNRKYNKGRMNKQHWVVGGIVRETKDLFLVEVERRDSKTISNIIEENVLPKTRIITDKWKGYSNINKDYMHLTVNHSLNFIDPDTGEHTNTIESIWGKVKQFFPHSGLYCKNLTNYIETYIWKYRNNGNGFEKFLKIC